MRGLILILLIAMPLAGCAALGARLGLGPEADAPLSAMGTATPAPAIRPPTAAAQTVEDFDTTTAEQRAEAAAPVATTRALGSTVAALGSPTEPGFWLKTPLVKTEVPGLVVNPATGKSAAVTLIPIEGPPTAGSRMSLAALRLIGAGLGDLTTVEVSLAN